MARSGSDSSRNITRRLYDGSYYNENKTSQVILFWVFASIDEINSNLKQMYLFVVNYSLNVCIRLFLTILALIRFDTGDIVRQYSVSIKPDETAVALTNRLAILGAQLLMECVRNLPRSVLMTVPQQEDGATYGKVLRTY